MCCAVVLTRTLPPFLRRRDPASFYRAPSQEVGFISFLVRPLYILLARILPDLAFYTERIDASLARWTALRQEAIAAVALPPPPASITVAAAEARAAAAVQATPKAGAPPLRAELLRRVSRTPFVAAPGPPLATPSSLGRQQEGAVGGGRRLSASSAAGVMAGVQPLAFLRGNFSTRIPSTGPA